MKTELKFTLEQRKEIYQRAYEIHLIDLNVSIRKQCPINGMCTNLINAIREIYNNYAIGIRNFIDLLPEFWALKSNNKDLYEYWWDAKDYEIRKKMYEEHLINI